MSSNKTLGRIPKYRMEFIKSKVDYFIDNFNIYIWPLDMVKILIEIEKDGFIPLILSTTDKVGADYDAITVYCKENNKYVMLVNQAKVNYPFKSSFDRRLNFTLAHELGHILLDHFDIPNQYKSESDCELEEREADEFAARLLMPDFMLTHEEYPSLPKLADYFNVSVAAITCRLKYNNLKITD